MTWRNKKGSLSLSIQAIVILVMAMAVLGLGLGFIRGLMGKGQDQFSDAIANAKLKNPASSDVPITLPQSIKLKAGDSTSFEVGVYNNGNIGAANNVKLDLNNPGDSNCPRMADTIVDPAAIATQASFRLHSLTQAIPPGTEGGFIVSLQAGGAVSPGTYICTIKTPGTLSKQIYVEVGN